MSNLTTIVTFRTTVENKKRIDNLAKETKQSSAFFYNYLLDVYLDDLEDIFLGEQFVKKIRNGKIKTVSADNLYKDLDL